MSEKNRWVIGITGNIGAGKSTVTRMLAKHGAFVIDADVMAKQLQQPGSEAVQAIAKEFGPQMAPGGVLNRAALGALVFSDEGALKRLNDLMWPRLVECTKQEIEQRNGVCIIDAPLLIEAGLDALCDEVWLIMAPEKERCMRIIKRDGLSEEEAWRRIQSQMPEEEKKKHATCFLDSMQGEQALIETALAQYEASCQRGRR